MAKKRLFEILDEMNQNDAANNTATVGICPEMIEVKKTNLRNGFVKMGVPGEVAEEICLKQNKLLVLLVIDEAEYNKIKSREESNND